MDSGPYSFGPFRLDPGERRLTRDGELIEVSGRYFDALALLAAENGKLVTKSRFMDDVWRGVPVTDEALTQCIRSLRKALGDEAANPHVIETVPRHGYRLLLPVNQSDGWEPGSSGEPVKMAPPSGKAAPIVQEAVAAGLGGACAGLVAALGYLMVGLVTPRIGTASTLAVLLSINLLLGFAGGAAIGAGIALASRDEKSGVLHAMAGGAAGGLLIGAIGRMVGSDLFTLFFGQAPARTTGALEGAVLGLACGIVIALAGRTPRAASPLQVFLVVGAGLGAGAVIAVSGGRLMVGSLAQLALRFPANKLAISHLSDAALALATVAETTLFVVGAAWAIIAARRLRS